jgi:hypothetical protein
MTGRSCSYSETVEQIDVAESVKLIKTALRQAATDPVTGVSMHCMACLSPLDGSCDVASDGTIEVHVK